MKLKVSAEKFENQQSFRSRREKVDSGEGKLKELDDIAQAIMNKLKELDFELGEKFVNYGDMQDLQNEIKYQEGRFDQTEQELELIKEMLDAGEVNVSPITGREQLNTSGQTVLFDIFSEAGHQDEPAKPSMTPKEEIPSRGPGSPGLPGIQPLRQGLAQPGSGFAGFPVTWPPWERPLTQGGTLQYGPLRHRHQGQGQKGKWNTRTRSLQMIDCHVLDALDLPVLGIGQAMSRTGS